MPPLTSEKNSEAMSTTVLEIEHVAYKFYSKPTQAYGIEGKCQIASSRGL